MKYILNGLKHGIMDGINFHLFKTYLRIALNATYTLASHFYGFSCSAIYFDWNKD